MIGRFKLDGMYLIETASSLSAEPDPLQTKFLHYDPASSGWAVSKFNSTCIDDTCFFAYAPGATIPPNKGYVYGGPELHIYVQNLLFDEAETQPALEKGYKLRFSYTPDPNVPGFANLQEYNGRYILQPRYVHMGHQRYGIMPISFKSPGKKWVVTGLLGKPRKRQIILTATDPSDNRYMPPEGPWLPEEFGFALKPACANHAGDLACLHLKPTCQMGDSDGDWVRQCCRDTCGSCQVSRALCPLPKAKGVIGSLMAAQKIKEHGLTGRLAG